MNLELTIVCHTVKSLDRPAAALLPGLVVKERRIPVGLQSEMLTPFLLRDKFSSTSGQFPGKFHHHIGQW